MMHSRFRQSGRSSAAIVERPRGARGILPLIAAALGAGAIRAGVGMLSNRSETRRNRNLINDAYVDSSQRLGVNQANVRQDTDEGLARRGLLGMQGGARATIAGTYGALGGGADGRRPTTLTGVQTGPAATTLGGQTQANTEQQLGFERKALDFEHDKENAGNDANSRANTIGAISSGIQTGVNVYGAGQMMGAGGGASPSSSPIASAYLSGGPASHFGGIDAVDPLGHPDSAWHPSRGTINGAGMGNDSFNVG